MLYPFKDHTDKYGYINALGEVIVEPCFDYADEFSDGLARAILTQKTKSFFGKTKKLF